MNYRFKLANGKCKDEEVTNHTHVERPAHYPITDEA
jgi:hypothetical protein